MARILNIPITRLETWARKARVPHLRAGVSRGVEYTAEDIRHISQMLPELMGGRRGVLRAGASDGQQTAADAVRREPTAETIAGWAQLRAHRPAARRSAGQRQG